MTTLKLVKHNISEKTITVELSGGNTYNISYYVEDGYKYLTHNNGFCADTSNLTTDYPDNDDYKSDDELKSILDSL